MVEHVEEIGADDQRSGFTEYSQTKFLCQGKIHVPKARARETIAPNIPQRTGGWIAECRNIEQLQTAWNWRQALERGPAPGQQARTIAYERRGARSGFTTAGRQVA